ncbi:hypothetical protein T492DRAFT_944953 [Pavlovales sp. CCMP2436]|nr:hypothetical protein T492DRAFT_944953 [Pavlovales sp. CCMP2436]
MGARGKGTASELKARNKRWRVTSSETSFLEAVFLKTRKPSRATTEHLAHRLAVRPRQAQVWFQNRRQRLRKESPTAPSSPVTGDMSDCDTMHPDSLDSLMRQFLDLPGGRAASEEEEEEEKDEDGRAASDGSAASRSSVRNSSGETDEADDEPNDPDGKSVWQTMCGSRRSTKQHFNLREKEESEAAYLHELASLIDIRPGSVSLGDSLCYSLGGAEAGSGATGGSGELGVFHKLPFSSVDEAAQAALGVDWLLTF